MNTSPRKVVAVSKDKNKNSARHSPALCTIHYVVRIGTCADPFIGGIRAAIRADGGGECGGVCEIGRECAASHPGFA